jgi:oxygen-dependent protoporphyrinogen oxidase
MNHDAVILGAGPAGLAVASALARQGRTVKIIEPSHRWGGSIRTVKQGGWLVEVGPNTLQVEGAEDFKLLENYGLKNTLQTADTQAAKRFIFAHGQLHGLTNHPLSLFKSGLLSWSGKMRLLLELFVPRGGHEGETIHDFIARRFGEEAALYLMDPVVSGVHAGDPARLVMEKAFPRIQQLEQSHRSILWGLARTASSKRDIVGFKNGMQELADGMARTLPEGSISLNSISTMIRHDAGRWHVAWRDASGADFGTTTRHLIITVPHWHWNSLPLDENLVELLRPWERSEAPPVTVVARGYDRSQIEHALDGFGYLTAGLEHRQVLGCLFPSAILPQRTPEGKVLLCCFIGGARHPRLARLTDEELHRVVDEELSQTLGVKGQPEQEWIQRWERSIPQYVHDQTRREVALAEAEKKFSGLHFHGAFRGGISLMQVIRKGDALGQEIAALRS